MNIIIIGAGPGISQGVAEKFGKEGFQVGLVARHESKLQNQVEQLRAKGITAHAAAGNAADPESLKNALFQLRDTIGHADMILYNAAGVTVKDVLEQDWDSIKADLDISVGGAFHLLKLVLPFCLKENKGKLFFTGGGFALGGDPQWTSLSIGKAALRNMLQAFQKRVKDTNIHIAHLMVCGYVNPEDAKYNPAAIAEEYWKLYQQMPGAFQNEVIY